MVAGITSFILSNREKVSLVSTTVGYVALLAAIAMLLKGTGGINSPFIFLWALIAAFSALFGIWSVASALLVAVVYFVLQFIGSGTLSTISLPTLLAFGMPVAISLIVWPRAQTFTERRDRDPAAYKQRSDELTSLIEESEVVVNAIGDGVLAVDNQGVIQLINPAAQSLLGWSRQDALSLQYQSVLKLTDEENKELPDVMEPIKQALNMNQEVRSKALQLETKNGKKLFVSLVASPLGDAGSGVIAVVRDITKERSEGREQAEFISTASHEMRTPVASIEGYLGLALNPSTATIDEKARDYIMKAHESARHLGRLFQDLLDVSKSEDGRLSNNPTVLDLVAYTGGVVEGLHQKAAEKGLLLTFKPGYNSGEKGERRLSPVYYANLDKDHVREVINNLTENAIKYTLTGEVSVDVKGDDDHIIISVTDTGVGIPGEDLPHLFQKFYRVDSSDTREIGGTGLGLYLCRRLVETLGGRIWAESVYQQGSTFHVELPRIDTQEAQRLLAIQAKEEGERQAEQAQTPLPAPEETMVATAPRPIEQNTSGYEQSAGAEQEMIPQQIATPVHQAPRPQSEQTSTNTVQQFQEYAAPAYADNAQAPYQPPQYQQAPQAQTYSPAVSSENQQPQQPATPPERLNIPLAHIEQNPGIFMQQRAGSVAVPTRNDQGTLN